MKKSTIVILCIIAGVIGLAVSIIVGFAIFKTVFGNNCIDDPIGPYGPVDKKPVIYLYPNERMKITVRLGDTNKLTSTYPKYNNGWTVIADPDGTLTDVKTGRQLYSLYWEGRHTEPINMNEGFIVKGEDTIKFLEEKLAILGLNEKESEEFIIYWLPILENNKYNYIRFADIEEINKNMPLEFSLEPDAIIRVLMQFKALDKPIKVKEQQLKQMSRVGFTVVEWGGSEIK